MDFKYSSDYDIILEKDIVTTDQLESDSQCLDIRLVGTNPEFIHSRNLCVSFDDYRGCPNIQAVGKSIEQRIVNKLAGDNRFPQSNLSVDVYPIDINTMQGNIKYTSIINGTKQYIKESSVIEL